MFVDNRLKSYKLVDAWVKRTHTMDYFKAVPFFTIAFTSFFITLARIKCHPFLIFLCLKKLIQ
jgi:hypothetical protein